MINFIKTFTNNCKKQIYTEKHPEQNQNKEVSNHNIKIIMIPEDIHHSRPPLPRQALQHRKHALPYIIIPNNPIVKLIYVQLFISIPRKTVLIECATRAAFWAVVSFLVAEFVVVGEDWPGSRSVRA